MSRTRKNTKPITVHNLAWLGEARKLWLNPDYQRESVWTRSQNQLLIDSLLRDIDIPKLYFREIDKGSYEYEVVDGQQRLRAIFDFIDDRYKLPNDADDVYGTPIAGSRFSELDTDLQMQFRSVPLDVVVLSEDYSDDDIEEIFLRLQNGTPLNAPEKRRAIAGSMRNVVAELSGHRVFELAGFTNKRFAYEDAVAKALHLLLYGTITDIRPVSVTRTYENHRTITTDHREVKRLKRAYGFLSTAFAGRQSPKFKKYSLITLGYLIPEMLDEFDLSKHSDEFAECYLDFEARRIENEDLSEELQDTTLAAYTNAARADSIPDMRYRHDYLKNVIIESIPDLVLKDPTRDFTNEQRLAIYRKDGGVCQWPRCDSMLEEKEFHADHIIPHSRGGETTVANGQVLCQRHNLQKGDRT